MWNQTLGAGTRFFLDNLIRLLVGLGGLGIGPVLVNLSSCPPVR